MLSICWICSFNGFILSLTYNLCLQKNMKCPFFCNLFILVVVLGLKSLQITAALNQDILSYFSTRNVATQTLLWSQNSDSRASRLQCELYVCLKTFGGKLSLSYLVVEICILMSLLWVALKLILQLKFPQKMYFLLCHCQTTMDWQTANPKQHRKSASKLKINFKGKNSRLSTEGTWQ